MMKFKMVVMSILLIGVAMKTNAATDAVSLEYLVPEGVEYSVRRAVAADLAGLVALYKTVAVRRGCLAGDPEDYDEAYIADLLENVRKSGLMLVAVSSADGTIVGAVSKYASRLRDLRHTLSSGTTLTHPSWEGRKIATTLWSNFLKHVETHMPHIARVELFVRASNVGGIKVYTRVGFVKEVESGLRRRIINASGKGLEDDWIMGWLNPAFDSDTISK